MPALNQPLTLRDTGILKMSELLNGAIGTWTDKLHLAAGSGIQDYHQAVQDVTTESSAVREYLTSLPVLILHDLTPSVIRWFVDKIASCDEGNRGFKPTSSDDEVKYNAVCTDIVKCVLVPSTKRYITQRMTSSFAQKLIIETLNATSNLTHLAFDTKTETNNSALLASNIQHLTQLVSLQYKYHCTDEVVRQLALHCKKLDTIDVSDSGAVTDNSTNHIVQLRELTELDVTWTSISPDSYAVIISQLPNIKIMKWHLESDYILERIPTQRLQRFTRFEGFVQNINNITQQCSNIRSLILTSVQGDLSSLSSLNNLVRLHIRAADYVTSNMQTALQGVGSRLQELELYMFSNVNMAHIVTLCPKLRVLTLKNCGFVQLQPNTTFRYDLPHFRSVEHLDITQHYREEFCRLILLHYVNVTEFLCYADILDDTFMRDALRNGAFTKITNFFVRGSTLLTMSTIDLLLLHCQGLNVVGHLNTWTALTVDNRTELRNRIRQNNWNLDIA